MGMLDGGVAGVFAGIMGAFYPAAILHRAIITHDSEGGGSESFSPDEDCQAQLDKTIERLVDGNPEKLQGILLLATVARPSTDDEITAGDDRWQIATIETDPAGSYFLLGGRKSSIEAGS